MRKVAKAVSRAFVEELESRRLMTYWNITLGGFDAAYADELSLQGGSMQADGQTQINTTPIQANLTTPEEFIKSLVSGTISGTYDHTGTMTPFSFQFGGDAASDGSKPILFTTALNEDGSVWGSVRVCDSFNTDDEDGQPHEFTCEEWEFTATPVPEVTVEQVQNGSEDDCQEAQVKFTRSGAPTGSPVTVYFTLSGSAVRDDGSATDPDYGGLTPAYVNAQGQPVFSAEIASGQTSVTVGFTPMNDALVEGNETIQVALADPPPGAGTPPPTQTFDGRFP
jgi:hypothetical protein